MTTAHSTDTTLAATIAGVLKAAQSNDVYYLQNIILPADERRSTDYLRWSNQMNDKIAEGVFKDFAQALAAWHYRKRCGHDRDHTRSGGFCDCMYTFPCTEEECSILISIPATEMHLYEVSQGRCPQCFLELNVTAQQRLVEQLAAQPEASHPDTPPFTIPRTLGELGEDVGYKGAVRVVQLSQSVTDEGELRTTLAKLWSRGDVEVMRVHTGACYATDAQGMYVHDHFMLTPSEFDALVQAREDFKRAREAADVHP